MGDIPLEGSFAFKLLKKFDTMRERVEHFIAVINLCPLPAFICTRDARAVLFVNPAFTRITGKNLEDLQEMGWLNTIHPDDRAKVELEWAKYATSMEDNVTVARARRYRNGGITFEATLYTTALTNNGVVGYIVPRDCAMMYVLGIDLHCPVQQCKATSPKMAGTAGDDPAT